MNNHIVPKVYLKNFSNKNQIYVFDKKLGRYFEGKPNIKNVACEKEFYDEELESYFAEIIEPNFDKFIKWVFKNDSIPSKETKDFIYFICFINSQRGRVKSRKEDLNEFIKEKFLKDELIQKKFCEFIGEQNLDTSKLKIDTYPAFKTVIADSTKCVDTMKCFIYRQWRLLITNENFITSDNPFILTWEESGYQAGMYPGLASLGSIILFPISSKYVIEGFMKTFSFSEEKFLLKLTEEEQNIFCHGSHSHGANKILTKEETNFINRFQIQGSQRFLFSKEKDIEKYLK